MHETRSIQMLVMALPTKFWASAMSAMSRETMPPDWRVEKNEWLMRVMCW